MLEQSADTARGKHAKVGFHCLKRPVVKGNDCAYALVIVFNYIYKRGMLEYRDIVTLTRSRKKLARYLLSRYVLVIKYALSGMCAFLGVIKASVGVFVEIRTE